MYMLGWFGRDIISRLCGGTTLGQKGSDREKTAAPAHSRGLWKEHTVSLSASAGVVGGREDGKRER